MDTKEKLILIEKMRMDLLWKIQELFGLYDEYDKYSVQVNIHETRNEILLAAESLNYDVDEWEGSCWMESKPYRGSVTLFYDNEEE